MRIMMAEDETALAKAVGRILERNNYSVDIVHNGIDALQYLASGEYDLAILDIMMPGMDGITVLQRIRQQRNPVPVILLTAKSEINDKVSGLDSGANDYIAKPFDTRELLARIRVLTRSQQPVDSKLHFGNISLDRANFMLSSTSGSFRLANKEFQMMEMLMSNPGILISSERFMEKSGAMKPIRRSMWYGSTSLICEKNWQPCRPISRSDPPETQATRWRRSDDSENQNSIHFSGHGSTFRAAGCHRNRNERCKL